MFGLSSQRLFQKAFLLKLFFYRTQSTLVWMLCMVGTANRSSTSMTLERLRPVHQTSNFSYNKLTVKPSQAYPPRFYLWIDYLKNESVSRSRNWCQIQSGISACVMSSEYFMRTSLYLVRLEIFEWIKVLRRHLHQFQENGAGRNFITASRVNSRLITHTRMQRSIWNLQLAMDSTFE